MHFTETIYRNPYWPTFPLLQITQGCTHNSCKFCTMYRNVNFRMQPMEWIEEDLQELAEIAPDAKTIQLLSANPLCMTYDKLAPILMKINQYLPRMEYIPLSEKEMLVELKTFVEHLTCDCSFITHHTVSGSNLSGPDFLKRKDKIIAALDHEINHGDLDRLAAIRRRKRTL